MRRIVPLLLSFALIVASLVRSPVGGAASAGAFEVASPYYTITDLGTLGGDGAFALDINSSGQVVGQSVTEDGTGHAFLWTDGEMADLGTLPWYVEQSLATALNDVGQVVGWSTIVEASAAFEYTDGELHDLGGIGGYSAAAYDINGKGQVVGNGKDAAGFVHAFLRSGGVMRDLGTLDGMDSGETSTAYGINASGQVVGVSSVVGPVFYRAFRWTPGTGMIDLGTLGGSDSWANDINDAGQVVGWADSATAMRAFIWTADGGMRDLGALPDRPHSTALALNSVGKVVGFVSGGLPDSRAAFFYGGAVIDLNAMIPSDSGWVLAQATGINDAGQIVGFGEHNGQFRAFLLTPSGASGAFCDVAPGAAYAGAVALLAERGIARGTTTGCFLPAQGITRAELAALIVRATPGNLPPGHTLAPPVCLMADTWDCEDWGNDFTDRGGLVASLWRSVGTLQHYEIARGYDDAACAARHKRSPCFGPNDPVTYAQAISLVVRMMQTKGYWVAQPGAPLPYSGVPGAHQEDVRTFAFYAGSIPTPPAKWSASATRGWIAMVLAAALDWVVVPVSR